MNDISKNGEKSGWCSGANICLNSYLNVFGVNLAIPFSAYPQGILVNLTHAIVDEGVRR